MGIMVNEGIKSKETKVDIPIEKQRGLHFFFVPHKEPRVWWGDAYGGEFGVHADMVIEEEGCLRDVMNEIMNRAEIFGQGNMVVHFKFSLGPISQEEMSSFEERIR